MLVNSKKGRKVMKDKLLSVKSWTHGGLTWKTFQFHRGWCLVVSSDSFWQIRDGRGVVSVKAIASKYPGITNWNYSFTSGLHVEK
jgi:hypothetical protein